MLSSLGESPELKGLRRIPEKSSLDDGQNFRRTRVGLYIVTTEGTMHKFRIQTLQSRYFLRKHMCLLSPLTINQILVALALLNKVPAVLKDGKITATHGA